MIIGKQIILAATYLMKRNWFLGEILEDLFTWEEICDSLESRFTIHTSDPFKEFSNLKLHQFDSVTKYFNAKRKLGHQSKLTETQIISGLTLGLNRSFETLMVLKDITTLQEWLQTAEKIASLQEFNVFESKQKTTNARSNFQNQKVRPVITQITNTPPNFSGSKNYPTKVMSNNVRPNTKSNLPTSPCRICESQGVKNQFHWH